MTSARPQAAESPDGCVVRHYQSRNLHGDPLAFTGSPIVNLPGKLIPNHKVTAEQVGEIWLREADPQTWSCTRLARKLGVASSTVHQVITGRTGRMTPPGY